MVKLNVPFSKLDKVIHISDVHIRLFKRHEEYRQVFSKLYATLRDMELSSSVILVSGDILHAKLDLSPESVQLASDFLKNLSSIAPTVVIDGNHDLNLANPHRLRSLAPIIHNIQNPNLHYLQHSGIYEIADVQFSHFAITDNDWVPASELTSNIKVALHHGPVYGAKTDTNFTIKSRHVEVSNFDGFDIAMLGDIHRAQILQDRDVVSQKPIVVYAGSLIQQNQGETLKGHGFIVWNMETCSHEFVEIDNDYGYITLNVNTSNISTVTLPPDAPKNIRLRVLTEGVPNSKLKKLLSVIKHKHNILDVSINPNRSVINTVHTQTFDIGDLSDVNIQNTLIKEWLETKYPGMDVALIEKIIDTNTKLNSTINHNDQSRNIHWKPLYFKFDNLFSYGENNFIDFTKLNGTNGIFAANASGKSSSMEAVIFALFDKTPRAFRGDHIMNNRKDTFNCKLVFEVNGEKYGIQRNGIRGKNGAVRVDVDFWKLDENNTKVNLNGIDRFDTNANIRSIVGTYEDFILTTLSGQFGSSLFIDKSHTERKNLLNQFMGLTIFEKLEKVANEESKELQGVLKKFSRDNMTDTLAASQREIDENSSLLAQMSTQITALEGEEVLLQDKIEKLTQQKHRIPTNFALPTSFDQISDYILNLHMKIEEERVKKSNMEEKLQQFEGNLSEIIENTKKLESNIKLIDEATLNAGNKEYYDLTNLLNSEKNNKNLLESRLNGVLDQINNINQIKFNRECEVCIENNQSTIKKLQQLDIQKNEFQSLIEASSKKIEEREVRITALEECVKQYAHFIELNNLLQQQKNNLLVFKNNITTITLKIKEIEAKILEVTKTIEEINKYISEIEINSKLDDEIAQIRTNLSKVKQEISVKNTEKMNIHSKIKVNERHRHEIVKQIQELSNIEQDFEAYKYYLNSIHRDGLPYHIISKVIPNIEAEINEILTQVAPFTIALDVDGKNFGGRIVYDIERSWPLENSSGMERFLSSLAIRVALIRASNLPKSNFLIIDEGMGSLDSEYLHSMQILFDMLKTQFDFVIVISHLDSIRDMVDDIIEIKKENGYSYINTNE